MEQRKAENGPIYMAGLIDGFNCNFRQDGLIDLNYCKDIIIVDRKYFLQNSALIYSWALSVEESESNTQTITA
jgi:hypothetical protein